MRIYNRPIGAIARLEDEENLRAKFTQDSETGSEDLEIRGENGPAVYLCGMTIRDKRRLVRVLLRQIHHEVKLRRTPDEFFALRDEQAHLESALEVERMIDEEAGE